MPTHTDKRKPLTPWTLPDSYFGETWEGYLVGPVGHNRDSDLLTESNWSAQIEALREIDYSHWGFEASPFEIVRENHWACGWVEWLAINPEALQAIAVAEALAYRLDQYPVLNEDDWSEREYENARETFRYERDSASEEIGKAFGLKARTIKRMADIDPDAFLSFMLDKVGFAEIRAEGGGASFVWEDCARESHPLTREILAAFLCAHRRTI